VDHPVEVGDGADFVADERIAEPGSLGLGSVVGPAPVGVHRVNAHPDELDVALGDVAFAPGELAELGGALRREVGRMEKCSPQLSPRYSCRLRCPSVVSAVTSGAGSPSWIATRLPRVDFLAMTSICPGELYCRLIGSPFGPMVISILLAAVSR
jgi:hypothetical protein